MTTPNSNIVLGTGDDAVTVYCTSRPTKNYTKKLTNITPPQSTGNWSNGPKDTKILDLLRIEMRITVNGYVDSTSEDKIENLFEQGGTFQMTWIDGSTTYTVNMEKLEIGEKKIEEQDEIGVIFTCVVGVNV